MRRIGAHLCRKIKEIIPQISQNVILGRIVIPQECGIQFCILQNLCHLASLHRLSNGTTGCHAWHHTMRGCRPRTPPVYAVTPLGSQGATFPRNFNKISWAHKLLSIRPTQHRSTKARVNTDVGRAVARTVVRTTGRRTGRVEEDPSRGRFWQ